MSGVRLNNSNIEELQKSFSLRDYGEGGKVFSQDIGPVIRSVKGLKPAESEVRAMVSEVDNSLGGSVDLQTLVAMISSNMTNPDPESADEVIEMFRMYDKEGHGLIPISDMRHLLTRVGEKLTDDEADELVKMSGCEERGQINFVKFVKIIMSS